MVPVASHLRSVIDQDGAVILDINRDQFFSLNPIGAYIWAGLQRGEDLDQIADALAKETGEEITRVAIDIRDFVADLKEKRLFETPAAQNPPCSAEASR